MDTAMVMDTTIRAASNKKYVPKLGLVAIAVASFMANGAEQRIEAVAGAEISFIDREYVDGESVNAWQYRISPTINYLLDGNHTDIALNLSHQWVGSDDSDLISSRSYTNYSGQLVSAPVN